MMGLPVERRNLWRELTAGLRCRSHAGQEQGWQHTLCILNLHNNKVLPAFPIQHNAVAFCPLSGK
jgi:hypothetical protein